jgi:phytol kinase
MNNTFFASQNFRNFVLSLLSVGVIFAILFVGEQLRQNKLLKGEYSRKFVHILTGCFVATWRFYLPIEYVVGLAVLLGLVVAGGSWLHTFGEWLTKVIAPKKTSAFAFLRPVFSTLGFEKTIGTTRRSAGDFLFAAAIAASAIIAKAPWIFCLTILHMALADGLAAVLGVKYGKRNQFTMFGQKKSVVGSVTVFLVSGLLLLSAGPLANHPECWIVFFPLIPVYAGLIALSEAALGYGLDNIVLPTIVLIVLNTHFA